MQITDLAAVTTPAADTLIALPLDMLALVGGGDGAVSPY